SSPGIPACARRSSSSRLERSRCPSARSATSVASISYLLRGGLDLGRRRLLALDARGPGDRQHPRGDDLVGPDLGLDPLEDVLRHVRVLAEERSRVLATLPEPLLVEAEVRAGLLDGLSLEPGVEHRAFPGDARAVDDVELRLLERRGDLVLHDLDADAVADRFDALLERLDAPDVEADRRIELERPAAGRRLGVPEHNADLLPELVREDRDRVGAGQRAWELAQALPHQPGVEPDVTVPHLAFDLGARGQRGDRVDGDDREGSTADEQ